MAEQLSVLLIEDDIHDVEKVKRAFATVVPAVFDLHHAARFLDAIKLIKERSFHVVILDLRLPDSVGLNGVERLMSMIPSVPVIVLTGTENDESALAGIALGAQEFLEKSDVTPKRLIRTIRHAIKRKQYSLQHSGGKVDSADTKKLQELADLMRETAHGVNDRVGTLMQTNLTAQQRSLLVEIDEKSTRCAKVATQLSPQIDLYEAKVKER
jgi:DNA-binding NtrC family response regulator